QVVAVPVLRVHGDGAGARAVRGDRGGRGRDRRGRGRDRPGDDGDRAARGGVREAVAGGAVGGEGERFGLRVLDGGQRLAARGGGDRARVVADRAGARGVELEGRVGDDGAGVAVGVLA